MCFQSLFDTQWVYLTAIHTWWNSYSHEYLKYTLWIQLPLGHRLLSLSCRSTVAAKNQHTVMPVPAYSYSINSVHLHLCSPQGLLHDQFQILLSAHRRSMLLITIQTALSISQGWYKLWGRKVIFQNDTISPGLLIEWVCSGMCDKSWVWVIVRCSFLMTNTVHNNARNLTCNYQDVFYKFREDASFWMSTTRAQCLLYIAPCTLICFTLWRR